MIYAKFTKASGDFDIGFFDLGDFGHRRPGGEIVLEFIHRLAVALGVNLYALVGQVAYRAKNLMARGGSQNKIAIAYALHQARDNESSRYGHKIFVMSDLISNG